MQLQFDISLTNGAVRTLNANIDQLVVAGWTGRDRAVIEHHIEELSALGVPRPSQVPLFYRTSTALLTHAPRIDCVGDQSSGEVEPFLFVSGGNTYVSIASDHTDRALETTSVAMSKQACPKPLARSAWLYEEVANHWDRLILRSYIGQERTLYQEGALAKISPPEQLISRYAGQPCLPEGTAMLCGTLGAIGGIRPAALFWAELEDPVLGRTLHFQYETHMLPCVS